MKKNNRAAALAVMSVLLSLTLNACVIKQEQPPEPTTDPASATTTQTEETTTAEDDSDYIEGRSEYMCSRDELASYDAQTEIITDASIFEDEELRDLAQSYMDQGYTLYDEGGQFRHFDTLGDCDYMFNIGFMARTEDDNSASNVWVYRMNEELFDHYLVDEPHAYLDSEDEVEDDGTVIVYTDNTELGSGSSTSEYNRDTGIGIYRLEWYYVTNFLEETDIDSIENEYIRDAAQYYRDSGYFLVNIDVGDWYSESLGDIDYQYGPGVRAFFQDQENTTEYYVYLFEGDEEIFHALADFDGTDRTPLGVEDDGTVITATAQWQEFGNTCTCTVELDRSTGLITINEVCPYNTNIISSYSMTGNQADFDGYVTEYTSLYGEPVTDTDNGIRRRVVFSDDSISEYEMQFVLIYDRGSGLITVNQEVV